MTLYEGGRECAFLAAQCLQLVANFPDVGKFADLPEPARKRKTRIGIIDTKKRKNRIDIIFVWEFFPFRSGKNSGTGKSDDNLQKQAAQICAPAVVPLETLVSVIPQRETHIRPLRPPAPDDSQPKELTMPDIPGVIDTRALGALLGDKPDGATDNAPQTRPEYRVAAVALMGRGMRLDDVAAALKISRQGALDLLAEAAQIERDRHRNPRQALIEELAGGRGRERIRNG